MLFPPDDVIGPSMPGTAVVSGPSRGLLEALAPLAKGSLRRGTELASEVMQRLPEYLTPNGIGAPEPYPLTAHPTVQEFWHLLRKAPDGPDPNRLIANDKVTGSRPPTQSPIQPPKGFTLNKSGRSMTSKDATAFGTNRDPQNASLDDIWTRFQNYVKTSRKTAYQPTADRPKLSGRWQNHNKIAPEQGKTLKARPKKLDNP